MSWLNLRPVLHKCNIKRVVYQGLYLYLDIRILTPVLVIMKSI